MKAQDIILKPLLTEKGYDGITDKRYTFIVAKNANKIQIKQAVEELFSVQVKSVNTLVYKGKPKRQGRSMGYTSEYKKAVVQLRDESKPIEFFNSLS
ncbi:MAG: 50S ribosomal protein L23 [Clostridia bacterium]|nr:50S ribosomal protein L23 [Clostridia bacterium]